MKIFAQLKWVGLNLMEFQLCARRQRNYESIQRKKYSHLSRIKCCPRARVLTNCLVRDVPLSNASQVSTWKRFVAVSTSEHT